MALIVSIELGDEGSIWLHKETGRGICLETYQDSIHCVIDIPGDQASRLRDALTEALGDEVAG